MGTNLNLELSEGVNIDDSLLILESFLLYYIFFKLSFRLWNYYNLETDGLTFIDDLLFKILNLDSITEIGGVLVSDRIKLL